MHGMTDFGSARQLTPPFERCPRCRYALRGLPANHACPECGLRYDERSEGLRIANAKQALRNSLVICLSGLPLLFQLTNINNLGALSFWDILMVIVAIVWLLVVPKVAYRSYQRYHQGYMVAIVSDGLIIRLPDIDEKLLTWNEIADVLVLEYPKGKPQIVKIDLKKRVGKFRIGGDANVFPMLADARRFADHVKARMAAAGNGGDAAATSQDEAGEQSTPQSE